MENELQKIREGVLALTDKKLIRSPSTDESKAFYYKMKSDCYRYFAEFATGETKSKAGEDACDACVEADKIAENDSAVTHPVRLAMDTKFLQSLKTRCSETNEEFDRRVVDRQTELKAVIDAMNKVVDDPVVQVPQIQVVEKTVEGPQLQIVEQIVETLETQTIQSTQTFESLGTAPVCQSTQGEIVEAVEIEVPLPAGYASLMPVTEPVLEVPPIVGKIDEIPEIRTDVGTQTSESLGTAPISQSEQVEIVEAVEIGTPIPAESGSFMFVKAPVLEMPLVGQRQALNIQTEQKTMDVPQCLEPSVDVPVVTQQTTRNPNGEPYPAFTSDKSWDEASGKTVAHRQVPLIHKIQKMVEVPQIQYIDKVVDGPVEMQPAPEMEHVTSTLATEYIA